MKVTRQDLVHANNMIAFLKKAEIKLDGMEIMAAADVIRWVYKLIKDIEADLAEQAALSSVKVVPEMTGPVADTPAESTAIETSKRTRARSKKSE